MKKKVFELKYFFRKKNILHIIKKDVIMKNKTKGDFIFKNEMSELVNLFFIASSYYFLFLIIYLQTKIQIKPIYLIFYSFFNFMSLYFSILGFKYASTMYISIPLVNFIFNTLFFMIHNNIQKSFISESYYRYNMEDIELLKDNPKYKKTYDKIMKKDQEYKHDYKSATNTFLVGVGTFLYWGANVSMPYVGGFVLLAAIATNYFIDKLIPYPGHEVRKQIYLQYTETYCAKKKEIDEASDLTIIKLAEILDLESPLSLSNTSIDFNPVSSILFFEYLPNVSFMNVQLLSSNNLKFTISNDGTFFTLDYRYFDMEPSEKFLWLPFTFLLLKLSFFNEELFTIMYTLMKSNFEKVCKEDMDDFVKNIYSPVVEYKSKNFRGGNSLLEWNVIHNLLSEKTTCSDKNNETNREEETIQKLILDIQSRIKSESDCKSLMSLYQAEIDNSVKNESGIHNV